MLGAGVENIAKIQYNRTNTIDPSFPSKNFLKLISNDWLSRTDISRIQYVSCERGTFP